MNDGLTAYERRVLAYVDALGFRALVEQSRTDFLAIQFMEKGLRRLWSENRKVFPVSTFSDHLAGSMKADEPALHDLFHMVVDFYTALLADVGILSRGAVTVGELVHNRAVIYGPALVRAYDLEQNVAIYPRVVIDEDVPVPSDLVEGLTRGEDGITFLNVFWPGWRLTCNAPGNESLRRKFLLQTFGNLTQQLDNDLPTKEHGKVWWFASHFNQALDRFGSMGVEKVE